MARNKSVLLFKYHSRRETDTEKFHMHASDFTI